MDRDTEGTISELAFEEVQPFSEEADGPATMLLEGNRLLLVKP